MPERHRELDHDPGDQVDDEMGNTPDDLAPAEIDAKIEQVGSEMQKLCQEIHQVHKAEEAREIHQLVEANVADGDRWVAILNSARQGRRFGKVFQDRTHLIAMASNLLAMASNPIAMAFNQLDCSCKALDGCQFLSQTSSLASRGLGGVLFGYFPCFLCFWVNLGGNQPPATDDAWMQVVSKWSQNHESRMARVYLALDQQRVNTGARDFSWLNDGVHMSTFSLSELSSRLTVGHPPRQSQVTQANDMAKSAAARVEEAQLAYKRKQEAKNEVAAKLRNHEEAIRAQKGTTGETVARSREAAKLAKAMVANGNIDIEQLKSLVVGGNAVWVFMEDSNRVSEYPEERRKLGIKDGILYAQHVWVEAEARHLLLQNRAPQQFGSFRADVGAKLFHAHTGSLYDFFVAEQYQKNCQTNYQRGMVRVELGQGDTGRLECELQQQLDEAAGQLAEAAKRLDQWDHSSIPPFWSSVLGEITH